MNENQDLRIKWGRDQNLGIRIKIDRIRIKVNIIKLESKLRPPPPESKWSESKSFPPKSESLPIGTKINFSESN